jgi:hypothetical protein
VLASAEALRVLEVGVKVRILGYRLLSVDHLEVGTQLR